MHILEAKRIRNIENEVYKQDNEHFFPQPVRDGKAHKGKNEGNGERKSRGDGACSQWPVLFCRMLRVFFAVPEIIDNINAAGNKAERDETIYKEFNLLNSEDLTRKKQWDEKKEVFYPMFRPDEV
jgi:hypothetical protein